MPVEAQTVSYTYIGDGSTTAFPFPSRILSASDIIVGVNGAIQTGVVVSGISDSGATVTLAAAPAAAARVVLLRAPPFSQLVDFVSGQTVLEGTLDNALDKLTMMAQYLLLLVRGAVRVSELSGDTPPLIETPLAPGRALIVNPAGDKIIAGPNAEDIAGAQGYAQQAEDARDLAEDYRDEAADWAALARNDWVVQQFTGDGVTTAFVLSADPGTVNNTFVTVDAVPQSKLAYTVTGTTLTLSEAPALGAPIEVAFGFRVAVGTPVDGSITEPKHATGGVSTRALADGSVTKIKHAASSVDASKLDLTDIVNLMSGLRISNVRQFGAVTGVGGTLATSSGTFSALGNNFSITRKSTTSKLLVLGLAHASLATTANQSVGGQLQMQYYTGAAYSAAPGNSSAELTDTSGQSSTRILRAPLSTMSILTQTELRSDTPTIWTVQFFGRQTQSTTTLTLTGYSILFVEFD